MLQEMNSTHEVWEVLKEMEEDLKGLYRTVGRDDLYDVSVQQMLDMRNHLDELAYKLIESHVINRIK